MGNIDFVSSLIDQYDLQLHGSEFLTFAIKFNQPKAIQLLIQKGLDLQTLSPPERISYLQSLENDNTLKHQWQKEYRKTPYVI